MTTTYSRTFYAAWFALFTMISMAMNGAHAFIAAPRSWAALDRLIYARLESAVGMPTWFAVTAVAVSQIPPVALACATNALVKPDPNTTSGRGSAARTTTWTIAAGAFVLSAIAMTDLTRMLLGVPIYVAPIMPVIVDVSIVAAVLRLEIRRSGHRDEAHIPEVSPQVEAASRVADAPLGQVVEHPKPRRDSSVERFVEQRESRHDAAVDRSVDRPVARPVVQREPLTLTRATASLARQIVAETTITQPTETVEKVLELALDGASLRDIGKTKIVSPSTAGRIITAARERDVAPEPAELVSV